MSAKSRVFVNSPLHADGVIFLDGEAARHTQVLRLQPGMYLELFNGEGGAYQAQVVAMGRQHVQVHVQFHVADMLTPVFCTQLLIGMPANARMDWLVEKATELGVSRITPLMTHHAVLKLHGDRAIKRQQHWLGIAQSACAQSGRNRVPQIDIPQTWSAWWAQSACVIHDHQFVLSLQAHARPWRDFSFAAPGSVCLLCGPEGGLSEEEESWSVAHGFIPVSLGLHTLRAETAPLVALSRLL
ncbi:MAG: 16S rRNA (uracil(1498)-N(3))-methyltransferase [Limnohabitans sp.]